MNLLSIGNSFSQDSHKWLQQLAAQHNFPLELANLVIGGCSLETHWDNVVSGASAYGLERNGESTGEMISIADALAEKKWDIITVQQASHYSGAPDSYDPYLNNLVSHLREKCPSATVLFHQTWAYEIDSNHGAFPFYESNQTVMFNKIIEASTQKAQAVGIDIIPTGRVIQDIRENVAEFDYQNGGLSLCKDGFHLSLDYGRYAAAATWLRKLMGKPLTAYPFLDFDFEKTAKIIDSVNRICETF